MDDEIHVMVGWVGWGGVDHEIHIMVKLVGHEIHVMMMWDGF